MAISIFFQTIRIGIHSRPSELSSFISRFTDYVFIYVIYQIFGRFIE